MVVQSRRYRMLIVPCVCIVLIGMQLFTVHAGALSQIDNIQVNPTTSKFVAPLSKTEIVKLEAMERFASLVAPVSALPARSWLLDDSGARELAVYRAAPVAGDLAEEAGDVWSPGLAKPWAVGVALLPDLGDESKVATIFEELDHIEAQADVDLYVNIPPPHGPNGPQDDETGPHFVEDIGEAAGEDLTPTFPTAGADANTVGGARSFTNKSSREYRRVVLLDELDAAVLGAL